MVQRMLATDDMNVHDEGRDTTPTARYAQQMNGLAWSSFAIQTNNVKWVALYGARLNTSQVVKSEIMWTLSRRL